MNKNQKQSNGKHQTKRLIRRWHRRIGVAVSLWLILLAITGILLNHSDDLSLQKSYVDSDWIINLYRIKAPQNIACFQPHKNDLSVCQIGDQIYLQNNWLLNTKRQLIGFYQLADFNYVITQQDVFIYTSDWQLIEHFNLDNGLPGAISMVGTYSSKTNMAYQTQLLQVPLLFNIEGKTWLLDQELIWKVLDNKTINPQSVISPTKNLKEQLQQAYLYRQITLLHFLQDLHSARIFSLTGKYLTDLVALLLIALSISGLITWIKRNRKVI
ncbi:MAG: PepSY domain-containing protein [Enterobacterales bacterium]|nr:PepSY domain-containing protein [Enterobacterales bacterium]